ncbi:MAG: PASTA domain-containing protein [Coriobacteriia bacterium]|nr:PASTA domain-containing protein [Coriobacteriia bacterium]MCL2537814.1 PASTA domain-containing protein [Coriobacteriia bacterium]
MAHFEHDTIVSSGSEELEAQLGEQEDLLLDEELSEEEEKPRGKKAIYALTGVGAVVMLFAVVAMFFALQTYDAMDDAVAGEVAEAPADASLNAAGETIITEPHDIVVARQTDYIFYNANLDGSMTVVDPVVADPVELIPEVTTNAQPTDAAAPFGENYRNLLGIDVLDAQAQAQRAGYIVHQVFVVCPDVVRRGAAPQRPGEVIEVQTYRMRGDGKRYMFLHVKTTEPIGNARAVPDLRGVQWQTARDRLRGVGLGPRYVYERNSVDTKGRVLFQAPQAGKYTPRGSTVIMVLADN